ncbi:hypothetical protein LINGRAHAP2_LOCUS34956 [Linum grandiflorum]
MSFTAANGRFTFPTFTVKPIMMRIIWLILATLLFMDAYFGFARSGPVPPVTL